MKTAIAAALATLLFLVPAVGRAGAEQPLRVPSSISGTALKAVLAAMPEFEKRGLVLDEYVIYVYENESSFVVMFHAPNRPEGLLGGTPGMAELEVEVSKPGLRVLRSNYVR